MEKPKKQYVIESKGFKNGIGSTSWKIKNTLLLEDINKELEHISGMEFLEKEGIEDMVMAIDKDGEFVYASYLIGKALLEQKNKIEI